MVSKEKHLGVFCQITDDVQGAGVGVRKRISKVGSGGILALRGVHKRDFVFRYFHLIPGQIDFDGPVYEVAELLPFSTHPMQPCSCLTGKSGSIIIISKWAADRDCELRFGRTSCMLHRTADLDAVRALPTNSVARSIAQLLQRNENP